MSMFAISEPPPTRPIWYVLPNNSFQCLNTETHGSKKNNAFVKVVFLEVFELHCSF